MSIPTAKKIFICLDGGLQWKKGTIEELLTFLYSGCIIISIVPPTPLKEVSQGGIFFDI
jgi:hypothetical protein